SRLPEPEAGLPDGPALAPLRHPQIPGDDAGVSGNSERDPGRLVRPVAADLLHRPDEPAVVKNSSQVETTPFPAPEGRRTEPLAPSTSPRCILPMHHRRK